MAEQALGSRLTTVPVPAARGEIVDRSGVVLATSLERRNVTVDQTTVALYKKYEKDPVTGKKREVDLGIAGAAAALAPVLGMDVATVQAKLTGTRRFAYVAKGVTPEVWRKVRRPAAVPGHLPASAPPSGSTRRTASARPSSASSARTARRSAGLELELNKLLAGTPGSETYERDPEGRQIPTGDIAQKAAGAGQHGAADHRPRPPVEGRAGAGRAGQGDRGAVRAPSS